MSELEDLYQQLLLDHSRHPRNKGPLPGATHEAAGKNPLCGDEVQVHARLEGERVAELRFEGRGCVISQAAASLMTEAAQGLERPEFEALFEGFHALVTGGEVPAAARAAGSWEKLAAFQGVAAFPTRVKCATLPWHALRAALAGAAEARTE